ncbi:hypothetical protein J2T16_003957 [Paenibacillus intestini]|nr:hypothetical protein [Paenibacillus intestini]
MNVFSKWMGHVTEIGATRQWSGTYLSSIRWIDPIN